MKAQSSCRSQVFGDLLPNVDDKTPARTLNEHRRTYVAAITLALEVQ